MFVSVTCLCDNFDASCEICSAPACAIYAQFPALFLRLRPAYAIPALLLRVRSLLYFSALLLRLRSAYCFICDRCFTTCETCDLLYNLRNLRSALQLAIPAICFLLAIPAITTRVPAVRFLRIFFTCDTLRFLQLCAISLPVNMLDARWQRVSRCILRLAIEVASVFLLTPPCCLIDHRAALGEMVDPFMRFCAITSAMLFAITLRHLRCFLRILILRSAILLRYSSMRFCFVLFFLNRFLRFFLRCAANSDYRLLALILRLSKTKPAPAIKLSSSAGEYSAEWVQLRLV